MIISFLCHKLYAFMDLCSLIHTAEIMQSQRTKDSEFYQNSQSFELFKVATGGLARLTGVRIQIKHWWAQTGQIFQTLTNDCKKIDKPTAKDR